MKRNSYRGFRKTKFMGEAIYGIIVLFVFAIIAMIGFNIYNDVNTDIQASDDFSTETKLTAQTSYDRYDNVTDGMFLTVAIFLWIVLLALSWFSMDHPIILVILIVLMISIMIVGAILSNTWEELTDDSEFSSLVPNMPITDAVLNSFLTYILVVFTSCGIVMFMRNKY